MRELLIKYWYKKFPPTIPAHYHEILNHYSDYYRNLNEVNKKKFLNRLCILLKFIRFIPKELPRVTTEMKVVIGSAIIQITFGLDYYLLKQFNTIYVLPRMYRYPGFDSPFLGHVDFKNKLIMFSWQDVQKGYMIADDAMNVALHEMAHCFDKEYKFRLLFRNLFKQDYWQQWTKEAAQKMEVIRAKQNSFLKNYAGTNMYEMFAVCVEAFFEKSDEFETYLPDLYRSMAMLLNQDPRFGENPVLEDF